MSISQTTHPQPESKPILDSLKIAPAQVKNVYDGLKAGEAYKRQYSDCLEVSTTLNNIIQDMNKDLMAAAEDLNRLNLQIAVKQADLVEKEIEIQKIKSKKIPWYRHPITIGIVGFAAGVWVAK